MAAKKRKRNPKSKPAIVRIDHKSTHGYQVRVPFEHSPQTRFFADGVHGSARKALKAAEEWRNQVFDKKGINPSNRRTIRFTHKNNSTGVVGVTTQWIRKGEFEYKHYVVSWCPKPYRQQKKTFSAHKYGDAEARKMAIDFRQSRVKEMLA